MSVNVNPIMAAIVEARRDPKHPPRMITSTRMTG